VTRRLLTFLVAAHVILGLYRVVVFDLDLTRIPSRLGEAGLERAGTSAVWLVLLLLASALWASLDREDPGPASSRVAAWGLAHLSLLGLVPYIEGLAGMRLWRPAGYGMIVLSAAAAAVALLLRMRKKGGNEASGPALGPAKVGVSVWDAATVLVLAGLLVPTVFPYVHFDAKQIWACRAFAFRDTGSLIGVGHCSQPGYPPLFSLLLWSGLDDPLFEGRLASWLVIALFLVFLRGRLMGLLGRNAAPAAAFVAATGHVAIGAGMFYANASLMAFLCTGLFLTLGLPMDDPRTKDGGRLRLVAGPLCLAAAVLVRPDGLVYVAVVGAAVLWERLRGGLRLPLWPFAAPLIAGLSWLARPAILRFGTSPFITPTGEWRTAGRTASGAVAAIARVFLGSWQGQWFGHWGLGVAVPLLAGIIAWRTFRVRNVDGRRAGSPGTDFYLHVSVLSLAAVFGIYLLVPFVGDPVVAVQPFEETEFLACYRNFIRVGMGRMTIHLLPFWVLFAASAFRDFSSIRPAGHPAEG
jgi:hypothetical protein